MAAGLLTDEPLMDGASRPARPDLSSFVTHYGGFRQTAAPPETANLPEFHRGLPSRNITVMISLGAPIEIAAMPDARRSSGRFQAFIGGLHDRPALVRRAGPYHGLHLFLTPLGLEALFGLPASALASTVVDLRDVLGPTVDELLDRLAEANGWDSSFNILDEILARRLNRDRTAASEIDLAWRQILQCDGSVSIGGLAREIGWSRRHFSERFRNATGVSPKTAARIARFEKACGLMHSHRFSLADVAAASSYFDQAHLTREWRAIAGCPPKTWIREELLFIQDYELASWDD